MTVCAIHQPQFLPWLGYLDKIRRADRFVFLDDVQFKKNEFQNRNRALVFGQAKWITVPVSFKFGDTLRQVGIAASNDWRRKTWATIEQNYCSTPFFEAYAGGLKELLFQAWDNLALINAASVEWLMRCFDMTTPLSFSSDMAGLDSDPTGRLLDICRRLGADVYLSGAGGRGYLDTAAFGKAGVRVEFQEYRHPVYEQKSNGASGEFVPFLSAIDALCNAGGGEEGRQKLFG